MIELPGILAVGFHPGYERKGLYSVQEVLSQLGNSEAIWDGDRIAICSMRYLLFSKSLTCICCGIEGMYFAKERSAKFRRAKNEFTATTESWHFNLYAFFGGQEVMLTKDHIVPRSKGGIDGDDNLQTMCKPCNMNKANHREWQMMFNYHSVGGHILVK